MWWFILDTLGLLRTEGSRQASSGCRGTISGNLTIDSISDAHGCKIAHDPKILGFSREVGSANKNATELMWVSEDEDIGGDPLYGGNEILFAELIMRIRSNAAYRKEYSTGD